MNNTKRKVINKIIAIFMILFLNMTDFMFVGQSIVSYALDAVNTNNTNVDFSAYFLNDSGIKVKQLQENINAENLKLYVDVSVKNEGYFNGTISIENSNFKLKQENKDENVSEISENTVKLKQINAGSTYTYALEIEPIEGENINISMLNCKTDVKLTGDYVNSKNIEKNQSIQINGIDSVEMNWKSSDELKAELETKVFTNAVHEINNEPKRIVQFLINSRIENNEYPVKSTSINVTLPNKVENATVFARETSSTNSNLIFSENNYKVNDNILNINILNDDMNNISWNKNGHDSFVVTLVLDKDEDITNTELQINSTVLTYDDKELVATSSALIQENVDDVISYNITSNENYLYKGKLYSGEEREYTTNTQINVNYLGIEDQLELKQEETKFVINEEEINANIEYKLIKISKAEFLNIFGEDGFLSVEDQNGVLIANINKAYETDENGKIQINIPAGTKAIQIKASKPLALGTLNIENVKTILNSNLSREQIASLTGIKERITKKSNNQEYSQTLNIELRNTTSKATFNVNVDKLSTIEKNENVKMTVVLENTDESKDLYQNPTVRIKFPSQVKELNAKYKLLYGNGLNISNANIIEENGQKVLEINLEGTQNSYNAEAIEGTTIIVKAALGLDKLATNSEENIILNYSNELATSLDNNGELTSKTDIVGNNEVILTNSIPEYKIEEIGNNGTKNVTLETYSDAKEATININAINNEGTKIKNVKILGSFPTGDSLNANLTSNINLLEVKDGVNVYYSEEKNPTDDLNNPSNKWKTNNDINNVNSYLITVDSMEIGETLSANYTLSIPNGLPYNVQAEEGYKITYSDELQTDSKEIQSTTLKLTTGIGPEINSTLKAYAGNGEIKDGDTLYNGEIIKYEVTLENKGNSVAKNVTTEVNIPNGVSVVKYVKAENQALDEQEEMQGTKDVYKTVEITDNKLLKTIEKLEAGEKRTYTFEVSLDNINENESLSMKASTNYEGTTSNIISTQTNTISNVIRKSDLSMNLVAISRGNKKMISGKKYNYMLTLKNNSGRNLTNTKIDVKLNSGFSLDKVFDNNGHEVALTNNTFTVDSLSANSSEITFNIQVYTTEVQEGKAIIYVVANDMYRSNAREENIEKLDVDITMNSNNEGETIENGDQVVYNITVTNKGSIPINYFEIEQKLSTHLDVSNVSVNNENVNFSKLYNKMNNQEASDEIDEDNQMEESEEYSIGFKYDKNLNPEDSATIKVETTSDVDFIHSKDIHLVSLAKLSSAGVTGKTEEINHILRANNNVITATESQDEEPKEPEKEEEPKNNATDKNEQNEVPNQPSSNEENPNQSQKTYSISGTAWIDKNEDGKRDSDEEKLSGVNVTLLNVDNYNTKKTVTTENGFYSIQNVKNGKYIVIFEYDTEKYVLTTYQKEGVEESRNSDVENVNINLNGEEKKVSSTDILMVNDNNISNIDIGLAIAKVFDLELTKTINKVTITNDNGVQTSTYNDVDLAKVEIAAKHLSGSTVVVEYKIKVKNNGEVAGYAKQIVDYKPGDLNFNSNLNSDWYQSGDYLYTTSLANTKIEAGETKELKLVLVKTMTETNTGLTNNTAEIKESYNSLNIEDIDSTAGNKKNSEDDMGSCDLIISVKTGAAVSYISVTLSIILLIGIGAYFVSRKVLKEEIKF